MAKVTLLVPSAARIGPAPGGVEKVGAPLLLELAVVVAIEPEAEELETA